MRNLARLRVFCVQSLVFQVKTKKKGGQRLQHAIKTHIQNWKCRRQYANSRVNVFLLKLGTEKNLQGINNIMQRANTFRYIEIKKEVWQLYASTFPQTSINIVMKESETMSGLLTRQSVVSQTPQ